MRTEEHCNLSSHGLLESSLGRTNRLPEDRMAANKPRPDARAVIVADPSNELPPALSTRGVSRKRPTKGTSATTNNSSNVTPPTRTRDGSGIHIDEVAWLIAGRKTAIESLETERHNVQRSVEEQVTVLKEVIQPLRKTAGVSFPC